MSTFTTGGDVDSWCSPCKLMILHTIVAIVDNKPKKVECNSCGATHAYKANPPGTKRKKKDGAADAEVKKASRISEYEKYMKNRNVSDAIRYNMKGVFHINDLIQHTKFGTGLVSAIRDTTKIEVLFPDGPRILVHMRGE